MPVARNMLYAIGKTPMVRLRKVNRGLKPKILCKLEYYSPSGSLKDRIYFEMISCAEERGDLKKGMTILECSTGNAGIACSFVGALKGYPVIIVMPLGMSEERKKIIRSYGAKIIETPGGESDVDLAIQKLREIKSQDPGKYWEPAQFDNPDNISAHYKTTGPEIWKQTRGKIDIFVVSQGTGGTLTGAGRFLRQNDPNVKLFAVEPAECPLLSKRVWGGHSIEGIGDGFVPRNLDVSMLTGVVTTTSQEAIDMAKNLALKEGIFCGISSGCNVAAAIKLAKRYPEAKNIVTLICDTGQRYFSTALCGEDKHVDVPERDHPMDSYTKEQLDKYQKDWVVIE